MDRYPLALLPVVTIAGGHAPLAPDAYGVSPGSGTVEQAIATWTRQGAAWVHVTDQDAVEGRPRPHLASSGAHLEYSGGVVDGPSLTAALATSARRVVIESDDLGWVASVLRAHGDRVVVGLDIRRPDVVDVALDLQREGCERFLATDRAEAHHWRHGDRHLLQELVMRTNRPVVVRGGIRHISDLHELMELVPHGIDGILLDDALYTGAFSYAEAVAACEDRFDLFFWGPAE
jgi:phosphoribosylformimino-5-aminoimidazole carboxamide ribonucleotide (ProFAR) isomerase